MQKLNLILFVFEIFSCYSVFSQTTFHKKYLQPGWNCQFIRQDMAGNIYTVSNTMDTKLYVMKCDSLGTPIWGKIIGNGGTQNLARDFLITSNGNLVISFSSDSMGGSVTNYLAGILLSMDSSGNILFSKSFEWGNFFYIINNIIEDSAGFTISVWYGDSASNYGFKLIKLDQYANILFERFFPVFGNGTYVRKLPDGGYIMHIGYRIETLYIDSSFTTGTWRWAYDQNASYQTCRTVMGSDSFLYHFCDMSNRFRVACTDIGMTVYWVLTFELDIPPTGFSVNDILELPDGSWYLVASIGHTSSTIEKVIIHADSLFSQLKAVRIPGYTYINSWLSRSVVTGNGELIITVNRGDSILGFPLDGFDIIKTDTTLSGICNAIPVGVQAVGSGTFYFYSNTFNSQILPSNFFSITLPVSDFIPESGFCNDSTLSADDFNNEMDENIVIYPTPAQDILRVNADRFISAVEISDIAGRIYICQFPGAKKFECNISTLSPGIYLFRLVDNEGYTISKSFVKGD